ncbi:MAG: hypothetical protein AAFW89_07990 [Bacteroidota bacterium]
MACSLHVHVQAQEIDFGDFYNYSITVAELNPGEDLDFGTVIEGGGIYSIAISNSKVITLTGVEYLDVIVDITADADLVNTGICSGSCSIPFTLEAAYANLGSDNIAQALIIPITSNSGNAQIPILRRINGPAGPPPTPVFEGFDPSVFNETAYLYLYGFINVGVGVAAGTYEGNITVSVIYD